MVDCLFACSYSYDLTHTLQFNMAPCYLPTLTSSASADQLSSKCEFWQTDADDDRVVHDSSCADREVEDASCVLQADLLADDKSVTTSQGAAAVDNSNQITAKHHSFQDSSTSTGSKGILRASQFDIL